MTLQKIEMLKQIDLSCEARDKIELQLVQGIFTGQITSVEYGPIGNYVTGTFLDSDEIPLKFGLLLDSGQTMPIHHSDIISFRIL